MIFFDGGQADVLGTVPLEKIEQNPDNQQRCSRREKCITPPVHLPEFCGERRGDQSANGVIGEPYTHHGAPFALREKTTDIFGQRRPAGGSEHALQGEEHAQQNHSRGHPHRGGNENGAEHPDENDVSGAESVAKHSPDELPNRVSQLIADIDPAHITHRETHDLRLLQFAFDDPK